MNNLKRKLLFGLYAISGLIIEGFILWLFPFTGLGGIICWPIAIVLSLVFGFILFKFTKAKVNTWQIISAFFILIGLQSYFQLLTIPQDFGGDAFLKISDAKNAFSKYEEIEFSDFPTLTTGERAAYIYKFKSKLPHTFILLTIDSLKNEYESTNPRTYLIKNTNGIKIYDKSKIKILESESATIITEYYNRVDTLIYKMNRNFLNISSGGYNDRVISLDVHEDDFKLNTGIEKLLYVTLSWTKKIYR